MRIKPNDLRPEGSDYAEALRRADHWAVVAERIVEYGIRPARADPYDPDHRPPQSELPPNIVGFAAVCAQIAATWAAVATAHATHGGDDR